jgi:hypothetical protein
MWFEIQVRSILEHAWAEIEHDLVYKTGIEFPQEALRRFAGLAAQLENLDREFLDLREQRDALISSLRSEYEAGQGLDETLDTARLLAALEVLRPNGRSFREMEAAGNSLPGGVERSCLQALGAAGIDTTTKLRAGIDDPAVVARLEAYASLGAVAPDEVSHLAVCVLVASRADAEEFNADFPDLLVDNNLREILEGSGEERDDNDDAEAIAELPR